jgi:hypothetical protein
VFSDINNNYLRKDERLKPQESLAFEKQNTARYQFYVLIIGHARHKPDGEESCQYRSMKQININTKLMVR